MECPGLDHPGQNRKERPKQNDSSIRGNESIRPGLDHPGRIKQQDPTHPGLDHPGTSGGLTPRTGSSGVEQEGAARTSRTRSSEEMWAAAPGTPDEAQGAPTPRTGASGGTWQPEAKET